MKKTLSLLVGFVLSATCIAAPPQQPPPTSPVLDCGLVDDSESSPPDLDAAPPLPTPLSYGSTVLLVGDSQAGGMSPHFKLAAEKCGYKFRSHFKNGTNTFQWIDWIEKDLVLAADLVVVSLGTNDALNIDRLVSEDSPRKLVEKIGARKYLWVLPPDVSIKKVPNILETRGFISATVENTFDTVIHDIPISSDKIHSTPEGYKKWTEEIWRHLESSFVVESCLSTSK